MIEKGTLTNPKTENAFFPVTHMECVEGKKEFVEYNSLTDNLVTSEAVPAEYIYRQSGDGNLSKDSGDAWIDTVKGNTLVWNQLYQASNTYNRGVTFTAQSDGSMSITGTNDGTGGSAALTSVSLTSGHKVLMKLTNVVNDNVRFCVSTNYNLDYAVGKDSPSIIITITSQNNVGFYVYRNTPTLNEVVFAYLIDLTKMFGAGNEPTSVSEFEAMYSLSYYSYNPGQLIGTQASGIETVGFNLWDEEWEVGSIDSTTGLDIVSSSYFRTKNLIPIIPDLQYYLKSTGTYRQQYNYDANGNFISYTEGYHNNIFTIASPIRYVRFVFGGQIYNYDKNFNLSDPTKNGTYEPYEKHVSWFNGESGSLATLTGKLGGTGNSVIVFPDSLNKVGTVYDEIQGKRAIKRIGIRAYTSGDESDNTVLTDGTNTAYVLTTPEVYILDSTPRYDYYFNRLGTEQILPNDTSVNNCPPPDFLQRDIRDICRRHIECVERRV